MTSTDYCLLMLIFFLGFFFARLLQCAERSPRPGGPGGLRVALGAFCSGGPRPAERHRQRLLQQSGGADRPERPVQPGRPPAAAQLQGCQVTQPLLLCVWISFIAVAPCFYVELYIS